MAEGVEDFMARIRAKRRFGSQETYIGQLERELEERLRVNVGLTRVAEPKQPVEEPVYEYRVSYQDRHFRKVASNSTAIFRSDDEFWRGWTPSIEEGDDPAITEGLTGGVVDLVIATAREQVADGKLGVKIERRVVGEWEDVEWS